MSVNLTIAGTTYAFPTVGENNWGQVVTNWATAVSTYLLQRTGGSFSLTNEVDFGANFATKQAYIKSRTANPASAGFGRLARVDVVSWRNQLNNGNLDLGVDSSNNLTWNGVIIPTAAAVLTANRALVSNGAGLISVSAVTATELGYVSGVTSAIQTQLDGKQASGSYITALTGDVTASGPGSAAATIGSNKVTNAMLAQVATATFKGRTTASTGNVEDLTATQATALLNAMVGDSGSGGTKGLVPAPGVGDASKGLSGAGTWASFLLDPMTTRGDMIVRNSSNVTARLAVGAAGKAMRSDGTDPSWQYVNGVVQTTATTASIAQNSDVVLADTSGASYTDTLPVAATVGNGKRLLVQKTTSDFNVLTVTDGTLTTTLNTLNETIELIVTGGAWVVLRRNIPSTMVSYTPTFVGFGTATGIACYWSRIGDKILLNCQFALGTVTGTEARMSLPGSLTIDNVKAGSGGTYPWGRYERNLGTGTTTKTGPVIGTGNNAYVNFSLDDYTTAAAPLTALTGSGGFTNTNNVSLYATMPVTGWNG